MVEIFQPGGSGSGTALTVKDGSTTVSNVSTIDFTGATVTNGGGGTADVLISASATSITVGTTTVASGTNTRILYDNSGVLGEYTITGTGTVVAMKTSPAFTTPNIGVAAGTSLLVSGLLASQTGLTLEETGAGTNIITLQAPSSLASGYTLTLPVDDGTPSQVLTTDGSGVLSWTTAGTGTVTSVTGTANRITSSGGATPAIDISAAYVGQASITTLGTITSGTWTGTTVAVANGGTGITSFGVGVATWLGTPSSANLASAVTDETGTGLLVFNNSPSFVDDITLGAASGATGSILLKGTTSGTVTFSVADAAGTWTMKLPTTGGTNGYSLTTDGSGNTTWTNVTGGGSGITIGTTTITSGTTTRILYDNAGVVGEYTLTGSGTVVAMQTAPTFVTSITSPLVIGGSGTTGTQLTLQTTTGNGTTDALAIKGGNNGATTFATFTTGALTITTSGVFTTGTIELGAASDTTLSRASAGVLAVEGVNVLLNGGALGTPSSGTLTNCTGLPVAGITSSTSTALGVGSLEIGNASDTTLARVSAGVASIEGKTIITTGQTKYLPLMTHVMLDATGDAYFEPYTILATNDKFGNLIGRFGASNVAAPTVKAGFFGTITVPNDYSSSGTVSVVVVWSATLTSGDVVFNFDYRSVGGNDTTSLDQATYQESLNVTDTAPGAANRRLTALMTVTAANITAGDTLEFYMSRDGVAAGDTMAGSAMIFDVYLSYTT